MKVAVFGLGYVGSVTAACLAADGHAVVGVDPAASKVEAILRGEAPVAEPGLSDLIRRAVAARRLAATTDPHQALRHADVALVCVGTPSAPNGAPTTTYVEQVAAQIAAHLRGQPRERALTVAFRSTMLPCTTASIVAEQLPQALPGSAFPGVHYAFVPEFLREATAIRDFHRPPFSVVGTESPDAARTLRTLFASVDAPVRVVSVEAAEALKYASNAFHAVKVAFANEMDRFCAAAGLDAGEMMELFVSDDVLNVSSKYLRPGFAFGGSCLPKDLRAITNFARRRDVELPLLESLLPSNAAQIDRLVGHVLAQPWRTVALLGLAFKSGTDDLRESPYVEVAERLLAKGLTVQVHDANVIPGQLVGGNLRFVETRLPHIWRMLQPSLDAALDGADVVIVGSEQRMEIVSQAAAGGLPVLRSDRAMLTWPVAAPSPV